MPFAFPNDKKPKRRIWFILNKCPAKVDILLVLTPTGQIQKARRVYKKRGMLELLVTIQRRDYCVLSKRSVIDVRQPKQWNKSFILQQIRNHEIQPLEPVPDAVFGRIKDAIRVAKTWSDFHKRLVLGPEQTSRA